METQARLDFSQKLKLDYTDFSGTGVITSGNPNAFTSPWTSGTGQGVIPPNVLGSTAITLPAGTVIDDVIVNVITPFTSSGGAITTLTLSLGDAGSATRYLNAIDLKTAAYTASTNTRYVSGANYVVLAVATIVGQTLASLNAGAVEIYLRIKPVNDLTQVN